jgi:hypothetical protein
MGEFSRSPLFVPSSLILRESAHERGEVGLMVFSIKPSHVPSPERNFHRKVKEATKTVSLESNAFDNLLVTGVWLIFL